MSEIVGKDNNMGDKSSTVERILSTYQKAAAINKNKKLGFQQRLLRCCCFEKTIILQVRWTWARVCYHI